MDDFSMQNLYSILLSIILMKGQLKAEGYTVLITPHLIVVYHASYALEKWELMKSFNLKSIGCTEH